MGSDVPLDSPVAGGRQTAAERRILLRSYRDLFEATNVARVLRRNQIGNNAGNLIFAHGVQRALSVPGATITADRGRINLNDADRINDQFDMYVVPLANAFRPSFRGLLDRYAALIERLRIPVVVVGVGAQFNVAGSNPKRLDRILPSVHRFVRAVLDRSASIGVRGEMTYDFLRGIGYSDAEVTVIGCPSLFQFGPTLGINSPGSLTQHSTVSLNVSPYVKAMGPLTRVNTQRYPNLRYVAQDLVTLRTMYYGTAPADADLIAADVPYRPTDPLLAEDRTRFFIDPTTWIDYERSMDFSFGSRIHGNIAALLAGTPAVVLAHDSRTVELADFHEIPYRLIADVDPGTDAAELLERADFSGFVGNQQSRFDNYLRFLESNGIDHVFSSPSASAASVAAFDRRIAAAASAGPVTRATPAQLLERRAVAQLRTVPRRLGWKPSRTG